MSPAATRSSIWCIARRFPSSWRPTTEHCRTDRCPRPRICTRRCWRNCIRVRSNELDRGISLVGPHRDDLDLLLAGGPAKGYASHGESWSFALALRLGAFALLRSDGVDPVLVLDDVFAELDVTRRGRLAGLVADADQVLITAAVPADVPAELGGVRLLVGPDGVAPAE